MQVTSAALVSAMLARDLPDMSVEAIAGIVKRLHANVRIMSDTRSPVASRMAIGRIVTALAGTVRGIAADNGDVFLTRGGARVAILK